MRYGADVFERVSNVHIPLLSYSTSKYWQLKGKKNVE